MSIHPCTIRTTIKDKVPFWNIYPVIGEGQWYDDAASHDIKYICESSWNISLLHWMKLFLDLCKSQVYAELIYNLSSLANFDIIHLLRSDWSNMALIQVLHPLVIL